MRTSRDASGSVAAVAPETARAQRKLELLTEANRAILRQLSLPSVLRQIAESARGLVDARYAALRVTDPDGRLEEFVHVGVGEGARQIGHPPTARGLLGVLAEDLSPLRLDRIADHPRHTGFPEHHPVMTTFLGVAIKVHEDIRGQLYLTDPVDGGTFSAEDETSIAALGATAGIAIENARLYEDSRRRQQWAEAAAEVSGVLLDPTAGKDPLVLIADTVLRLTQADVVSVVVPEPDQETFRVQLARGAEAARIEGLRYPASGSVAALALATGRGVRIGSVQEQELVIHLRSAVDVDAVLGLPLHGSLGSHGVLVVARLRGRPAFDVSDLELSESFAAQAAIAMELAAARADQQRLLVLQDRERIARDLHDHVIQRLFASGLTLEGLAGSLEPTAAERLVRVVDDLDVTIRQIRTLIFRLQHQGAARTLRSAVLQVVEEETRVLGLKPDVSFEGPLDTVADEALVDDVVAVTQEGLSNVVRHARATSVAVRVSTGGAALTLVVADDGVGRGDVVRRSGLGNLQRRAERHGGTCVLVDGPTGGAVLRWSVPLS